jgi:predicted GIY-YIG superfamily endonuclease
MTLIGDDECKWVCYLITSLSSNDTYIGATNNPENRLYNHNRKGKYGAKRTRGQTWIPIVIISGFESKISCLSFEAGWKRLAKRRSNEKLEPINYMCDLNLKYVQKDTKWNRIMDLLYFMHNFTYIEKKFKINYDLRHPIYVPPNLYINIFQGEYIQELPWTFFSETYLVDV